jgi:cyclic lactone autoinducer peptide
MCRQAHLVGSINLKETKRSYRNASCIFWGFYQPKVPLELENIIKF